MVDAGLRTLVTGGAGFIGSRIAAWHVALGHETLIVDDLSGGSLGALPSGAAFEMCDVRDDMITDLIADFRPDLVVHAAAQVSVARSVADPETDWGTNVDGTRLVVAGAVRGGTARIVFLSSGGAIYGECDGADESTETSPKSPYGRSKLAAEEIVRSSGLSYGIARLANVYGPGQRAGLEGGVVANFIDRLLGDGTVEIQGDGRQRRDLVFVDDVVDALDAMARGTTNGLWNVGTAIGTEILGLLGQLELMIGRSAIITWTQRRPGDVNVSRLVIDRIGTDLHWRPAHDLAEGLAASFAASTGQQQPGVR